MGRGGDVGAVPARAALVGVGVVLERARGRQRVGGGEGLDRKAGETRVAVTLGLA